jgi:hypothetical protein
MRSIACGIAAALALAAAACAPMIENGRDHRHDEHFGREDDR